MLHEHPATRTQELPGAELTHPFGDAWDVHKVGGEVFMLQTAVTGEPIVVLKATPAEDERSARRTPASPLATTQTALDHPASGRGSGRTGRR
jgi:predicted DNA-binding protein (MmcQ/YjbR family)